MQIHYRAYAYTIKCRDGKRYLVIDTNLRNAAGLVKEKRERESTNEIDREVTSITEEFFNEIIIARGAFMPPPPMPPKKRRR